MKKVVFSLCSLMLAAMLWMPQMAGAQSGPSTQMRLPTEGGDAAAQAPSVPKPASSDLQTTIWGQLRKAAKPSYKVLTTQDSLTATILNILQIFMGLLGSAAVVLIIYAGYLWTTAGGNDDQVSKAKTIIKQAAVGFLIVFLGYGIVSFAISIVVPQ